MVLVGYSDSEGSDAEAEPQPTKAKANSKAAPSNFTVDRANPQKIRVNLTETRAVPSEREDGEPAAKRPRVGAGAFSGFNAMLPAPKRDNLNNKTINGSAASTRKVFSLRTGAEPAFDRAADNELKQLFNEQKETGQNGSSADDNTGIPDIVPKAQSSGTTPANTTTAGKAFMFKPLSIARNHKKKKTVSQLSSTVPKPVEQNGSARSTPQATQPAPVEPPKKISLFSAGPTETPAYHDDAIHDDLEEEEDEIIEVLDDETPQYAPSHNHTDSNDPESLDSIANSLNLSAAERRQLLGRNAHASGFSAAKIVNFNTDVEYAANQASNHAGDQVQHNPVRAIAPGKHSLKQLVASAQGQKDALEESFATGRRNKKEAGAKYGW